MQTYINEQEIPVPNWLRTSEKVKLSNLSSITILFGKNGSGKSQFLRSWRNLDENNCHYVIPERTGEMDFQPNRLSQQTTAKGRRGSNGRLQIFLKKKL